MINDTIDKPFKCNFCSASFVCRKNFESHTRLHRRKSLSCRICKAVFSNLNSIKVHFWKAHSIASSEQAKNTIVSNEEAFVAPLQDRRNSIQNGTKSSFKRKNHNLNHGEEGDVFEDEEKRYGCVRCNKTFKHQFSASKHLKTHIDNGELCSGPPKKCGLNNINYKTEKNFSCEIKKNNANNNNTPQKGNIHFKQPLNRQEYFLNKFNHIGFNISNKDSSNYVNDDNPNNNKDNDYYKDINDYAYGLDRSHNIEVKNEDKMVGKCSLIYSKSVKNVQKSREDTHSKNKKSLKSINRANHQASGLRDDDDNDAYLRGGYDNDEYLRGVYGNDEYLRGGYGNEDTRDEDGMDLILRIEEDDDLDNDSMQSQHREWKSHNEERTNRITTTRQGLTAYKPRQGGIHNDKYKHINGDILRNSGDPASRIRCHICGSTFKYSFSFSAHLNQHSIMQTTSGLEAPHD